MRFVSNWFEEMIYLVKIIVVVLIEFVGIGIWVELLVFFSSFIFKFYRIRMLDVLLKLNIYVKWEVFCMYIKKL